ncbi:hypothetical protein HUJ04_001472 [Dendroctonus ponderosae]
MFCVYGRASSCDHRLSKYWCDIVSCYFKNKCMKTIMVISCVAYGCNNEQNSRKIPFHTFPFKRTEILKLWIQALGRDNWKPSKTSRICGQHFLSSDYIIKPGLTANLLKPNAVPSVFPFQKYLLPKVTVSHRTVLKQIIPATNVQTENELMDIDLPSTSTSTATVEKSIDKECQTVLDDKVAILQRKVKTLKQEIKRKDVKIRNMKDVINAIGTNGDS